MADASQLHVIFDQLLSAQLPTHWAERAALFGQPNLGTERRLIIEPFLVDGSELSHKWHDRSVCQRNIRASRSLEPRQNLPRQLTQRASSRFPKPQKVQQ